MKKLMTCLHDLLETAEGNAGVKGVLADWPEELSPLPDLPSRQALPVLGRLSDLPSPTNDPAARCFRQIKALSHDLCWRQSYDRDDFGDDFLAEYGWTMLAGEGGYFAADHLLITLLMLGPNTHYPLHRHGPEEIYLVIAGNVDICSGDEDWQQYTEGMTCHHHPWVGHALRTQSQPVLLSAIWKTDTFIKSLID